MSRILVLQHSDHGRPGRFGTIWRSLGFKLDVRRASDPATLLPTDIDDIHGLLILGGPQNVDEGHPWMDRERALIRLAHARELPVVGICLGCQLIGEALGGEVKKSPAPEQGFIDVSLSPAGQTETVLAGVPWTSPIAQSHAYEVSTLPPESVLLGSSKGCKNQVFRVGLRTYAFQGHIEADAQLIRDLNSDNAFNARAGVSCAELEAQVERHEARFGVVADRIVTNLATYAFPATGLLRV
ncbi:MAG: type 1 glutamine amidotransferase [Phycisphaerales bacterium]|nr:type 1 glutamine amidotransferase [Phycisphaerales bacterium]